MAGLGRKVFTAGDVLTASDVQNYMMDQSVMYFAGTAARSSAIATPTTGMTSYIGVTGTATIPQIETYTGSSWQTPYGITQIANVSVSAVNSIVLSNVFTSTYTNYVVYVGITTTVGSGNVALTGTIAGTNTGPWTTVGWTMGVSAGTGSSSNLGTGNQGVSSAPIANFPASGQGGFYINFQQPQLANRTGVQFSGAVADSGSGLTSLQGAAIGYGTDQLDGFKLTYGGTSFTGTIRVYGLRNS